MTFSWVMQAIVYAGAVVGALLTIGKGVQVLVRYLRARPEMVEQATQAVLLVSGTAVGAILAGVALGSALLQWWPSTLRSLRHFLLFVLT